MDRFKIELQNEKTQIDNYIAEQSQDLLSQVRREYGERYSDVFDAYLDVLGRGGKRVRGILAKRTYEFFGGKDKKVALEAALVIEMLHDYLLVVDDVEDESDLRRGEPAAHILLRQHHAKHKLAGNKSQYGLSQAINSALAGQNIAFTRALNLPVKNEFKVTALSFLNDFLTKTCFGQLGDFNNEAFKTSDAEDVRQVLRLKTAYYTFYMPVYFGASLAGAQISDEFNEYLMNTGICFQIYDDIIGTFGAVDKTGKSNMSDILEGKRTLLVIYAQEVANKRQKAVLEGALGNKQLTAEGFAEARKVIEDTGALKRCQEEARQLIDKANDSLAKTDLPPHAIEFFKNLAEYVLKHTKVG
jgi:geranylgeranyl diphosphate synthase type I